MGPRTEDRKLSERSGHSDDRKRQVTILRDYVEVLRKERDWLEAKLLNEHIHQASVGGLHGSALEELREETQREYAALLRKELQPTLEYFELVNEELMEEIPLKEEDYPNFDYPAGYDWREGDYMWLLFKIQQHFVHREVWTGVFRFINRTQPLRRVNHEQAMVELMESWQELFDKSIRVKRIARRALEATGRDEDRNMVDHLNLTAEAQDVQTTVLNKLVENTRQHGFDKLFNAIPIYDGEDPDKFEPWLTQLENACIVGKRDVREVAICSCAGPVLEVISSIDLTEPWNIHRDELRCFSPNKMRVHAANLLNNFRLQHATENLRSYIHQYSKIHRQATGLQPEEDYDLGRKVEFMKRLRNSAIANKIIKSQQFKEYTQYSLQSCFAKALELEGEFMVGEVVVP